MARLLLSCLDSCPAFPHGIGYPFASFGRHLTASATSPTILVLDSWRATAASSGSGSCAADTLQGLDRSLEATTFAPELLKDLSQVHDANSITSTRPFPAFSIQII